MLCTHTVRSLVTNLRRDPNSRWILSKISDWQKTHQLTQDGGWILGCTRRHFQRNRKPTSLKTVKPQQKRLAPVEDVKWTPSIKYKRLVKPFCFTVMIGGCSFVGASLWQYENVQSRMDGLLKRSQGLDVDVWSTPRKNGNIRRDANAAWNRLSEGQRVALGIVGLNCLVFGMWRVPALRTTMVRYFCSNPASQVTCWPMLLSTFSHYSPWHLAANMYVLYTFSTSIVSILGKEQFVAFYLTAGTFSSFASYVHKVFMKVPSMSLGASGAIMAVLAAVCYEIPSAQLAIIFLPWYTFSAGTALKALILLDTTGLVFRWSFFDHAAHLGGAWFGILYMKWGQDLIWRNREPLVRWWHNLRAT